MEFKPDWDIVRERFKAFWENRIVDRCCIAVTAPRKNSDWSTYRNQYDIERLDDSDAEGMRKWWCDPRENLLRQEEVFRNTFYGGEALPIAFTNWGAMAMCAFYGCEPHFNKKSVWYPPVIHDWKSWKWEFDPLKNPYWKSTVDITKGFAEAGKDRFFVGLPELGSAGDLLSLMRGMDVLCMDLYDEPEQVKAAIRFLTDSFLSLQDQLFDIVSPVGQGGGLLPWMSLWMPGRHGNQLACDFSSVLSKDMFREFFREELVLESQWTSFATYHLDGPACLGHHLDTILGIDTIRAIEWTPGASSPPTSYPDYLSFYHRVQDSGKKLILLAEPEEVGSLLENLSPNGLFIKCQAKDEEEALEVIRLAERMARH